MAFTANIDPNFVFVGLRRKGVAASAGYGAIDVFGMNIFSHNFSFWVVKISDYTYKKLKTKFYSKILLATPVIAVCDFKIFLAPNA